MWTFTRKKSFFVNIVASCTLVSVAKETPPCVDACVAAGCAADAAIRFTLCKSRKPPKAMATDTLAEFLSFMTDMRCASLSAAAGRKWSDRVTELRLGWLLPAPLAAAVVNERRRSPGLQRNARSKAGRGAA